MLPDSESLATIVVCEDDGPTLKLLCDHLTADRYEALPAPEASDALRHCRYKHPDLLLLDLMLPDAAGLDVLREIRSAQGALAEFDPELPVVVLSGRGADADRVRGFAEGADDYVVKPFHYPELVARIRAVLRRRSARREGPRRVGELSVDAATREVRVGRRQIELANKEFERTPLVKPDSAWGGNGLATWRPPVVDASWPISVGSRCLPRASTAMSNAPRC